MRKIANWWQDGLGTYTPPGHWNRFAKEFMIKYKENPIRSARTFAYMNMAIMDAGISCWDAKYYYHYPRPIETIPGFKTILGTPNFPSYTSGHSTFSAAASEVLSYVYPAEAALCEQWALKQRSQGFMEVYIIGLMQKLELRKARRWQSTRLIGLNWMALINSLNMRLLTILILLLTSITWGFTQSPIDTSKQNDWRKSSRVNDCLTLSDFLLLKVRISGRVRRMK